MQQDYSEIVDRFITRYCRVGTDLSISDRMLFSLHFELSGELRPVRLNIQRYLVSFVLRWLSEASSRMGRKGLAGMA